jgi:glycosyltransferase involved in cell wall biosynthesis
MNVSLIIPCYNEQDTIQDLLAAVCEQDYPQQDLEVIISDGMSTDATRERIREFSEAVPELKIKVVDNPQRTIPAGLNQAIKAASGDILVRIDAHSLPHPDYIKYSVKNLVEEKGDNVGGVISIRPANQSWIARSIARAAGHPLGVGDAKYRTGSEAREVDTVAFGAYRESLVEKIGGYDESLLTNEDYEFNVRVRKSGGKVWLDPRIRTTYISRPDLRSLAAQYWRYGYWKLRMLLRYPETLRWRQISGFFVLSWLGLGLLSVWFPLARWLLLIEALIYGSSLLAAGLVAGYKNQDPALVIGLPLAMATMHFSWGSGFIGSLIAVSFDKISRKSENS